MVVNRLPSWSSGWGLGILILSGNSLEVRGDKPLPGGLDRQEAAQCSCNTLSFHKYGALFWVVYHLENWRYDV